MTVFVCVCERETEEDREGLAKAIFVSFSPKVTVDLKETGH